MNQRLTEQVDRLITNNRSIKKQARVKRLLSFLCVFLVLYGLLLPAFTLEKQVYCGQVEHTHTDACYVYVLDCPVTGESGTVITAEEFKKLPGAAEALDLFEKNEAAKKEAASEKAETSAHKTDVFEDEDTVVSRAEKAVPSDTVPATASDYSEESGEDIYVAYDRAGDGPESADDEFAAEETSGYAVANSFGAVEDTSDEIGLIIADSEDPELIEGSEEEREENLTAGLQNEETNQDEESDKNSDEPAQNDKEENISANEIPEDETGLSSVLPGGISVTEGDADYDVSEDVQAVTEGDGEVTAESVTTEEVSAASEVSAQSDTE